MKLNMKYFLNYFLVAAALYLCSACATMETAYAPDIEEGYDDHTYTAVTAQPAAISYKPAPTAVNYTPKPEGSVVAISGDNMWYWN